MRQRLHLTALLVDDDDRAIGFFVDTLGRAPGNGTSCAGSTAMKRERARTGFVPRRFQSRSSV